MQYIVANNHLAACNLLVTSQKLLSGSYHYGIWHGHLFFANTPHATVVVRVGTEFLVATTSTPRAAPSERKLFSIFVAILVAMF